MNNSDHPNVGVDGGKPSGELSVAQRISQNFHGATSNMHARKG